MWKIIFIICLMLTSAISKSQIDSTVLKDTADYFLQGKRINFEILALAVASPDDISPNQRKQIMAWIQTTRKLLPKQKTPKQ